MKTPDEAPDAADRRILRILQADGRISNLDLARAVGLSSAATHDRVRRLQREGYIAGFSARLNAQLLGAGMIVFVKVRLADLGPAAHEAFKAAVQQQPEIVECHEVAGGCDYLLKMRLGGMNGVRDLVASLSWKLPGVRDVRTYAVLEELKSGSQVAL